MGLEEQTVLPIPHIEVGTDDQLSEIARVEQEANMRKDKEVRERQVEKTENEA